MKEYLDEKDMAKKEAVDKMIKLLEERYGCSCQPNNGSIFVIAANGGDGGDIRSNGRYEYDFGEHVSFLEQTEEEIVKILDEYFEIESDDEENTEVEYNQEAIDEILNLLRNRYDCSFEPDENPSDIFVMTEYGCDGGRITPDGDYYYDREHKVNALEQPMEEIIEILDKFFNELIPE